MASTLSPPARTPVPISAKPQIANAVPELFSGMTLPVQSIRCGAFLLSGVESGLEVHDQYDRTPRSGIHTVDNGRTLAGRIQMLVQTTSGVAQFRLVSSRKHSYKPWHIQ
jgi:hypothetical protein